MDISLAIFPWARWQGTQAAVKLNVMLSVAAELPEFCTLVAGGVHDVNFLDEITFKPGGYMHWIADMLIINDCIK